MSFVFYTRWRRWTLNFKVNACLFRYLILLMRSFSKSSVRLPKIKTTVKFIEKIYAAERTEGFYLKGAIWTNLKNERNFIH